MKAAVIHEHGGPERVKVEQVAEPQAGPGEVVVELKAAALNHLDLWVIKGGRAKLAMPHVLGSDGAGVVVEVGPGVSGVQAGEEVVIYPGLVCGSCEFCQAGQHSLCSSFGIVGLSGWGTYAQRVVLPAGNVAPKPAHLSFEQAAGLTLAHLTAWHMLVTRGELSAGQDVLIHGIGGGVALAALQLAKLLGARAIVTSSSEEKLQRARQLGADEVINYRQADVAARVRELTAGRGVDLAVDTVGAATWPIDIQALRRGGTVVLCGVTSGAEASTDLRTVYWNQLTLKGSTLGSREELRRLLRSAANNDIAPVIDKVFPLDQARQALERMQQAEQFGKIVLKM